MDKGRIVITSYKDPDMDGYSSAVAYEEILRKNGLDAHARATGRIGVETKFVLDFLKKEPIPMIESFDGFNSIILVDADCLESTEIGGDPERVVEIIDHHVDSRKGPYPNAKIQREIIGACATFITDRFLKEKLVPYRSTAVLLYAGIISNTINLKNKVTSSRDIEAARYLAKIGGIPNNFIKEMFEAKSDLSGSKLKHALDFDYYEREFFGKKMSMSQIEAVGMQELVDSRLEEIMGIIKGLTSSPGPDYQFLNLIDILNAYNIIISFNNETTRLLEKVLGIRFKDNIAKINYIIMRKEIIIKIKDLFENQNG